MRYHAIVSYDGSNYYGFQSQKNALGIQEVIEKALKNMTQQTIKIHSAGRTDKGVHAIAQSFHFDTELNIPSEAFVYALNRRLPDDIKIKKVKRVKDIFHARHSSTSKKYVYKFSKRPLTAFQAKHFVYLEGLNYDLMTDATKSFIGIHDFSGFAPKIEGKPTIKHIFDVSIHETAYKYYIEFHGNSFLKYMVRSMVGTLIEIGQCKKDKNDIIENLKNPNRKLAGKTAPGKGLYLKKVYYK
jgi:tRNA pseudouridine38-40 synthase